MLLETNRVEEYESPEEAYEQHASIDFFSEHFLASCVFGRVAQRQQSRRDSVTRPPAREYENCIVDLSAPTPREYGGRRPAKIHVVRTEREWTVSECETVMVAIHSAVRALFEDTMYRTRNSRCPIRSGSIVRMRNEYVKVSRDNARHESMCSGAAWDDYATRVKAAVDTFRDGHIARGIDEYIAAARDIIPLQIVLTEKFTVLCPVCDQQIFEEEDTDPDGNDGKSTCNCGREIASVSRCFVFKDHTRFDTSIKNSYNDLTNFIKRIDMFEGKQKTSPPNFLFTQLEEWFEEHPVAGYKSVQEIRDAALDSYGKKKGTTVRILEEALSATENSAFYKDIEIIGKRLFGWKLAELGQLRNHIISDYISTQRVYEEVKERESSLNVNLRLFFHLTARGYPCRLEDFKTVTSNESLRYHRRMIAIMAERTGLTGYIPF